MTRRRAIGVPLTGVKSGLSRSLADSSPRRSDDMEARMLQIPKLIVRVRFPSPAPLRHSLHRHPLHSTVGVACVAFRLGGGRRRNL
jgi:hypothetical protein